MTIKFGEWLPDLPFYENPGLVEAKNLIPVDENYASYVTLATTGNTLNSTCNGAFTALDNSQNTFLYAGTQTRLYQKNGSAWTDVSGSTYNTAADGNFKFAQFDNFIVATNYADTVQGMTVGGSSFTTLALSGTSPRGRCIGVINRFLMLGDLDGVSGTLPTAVQWSAIGDSRTWPPINTTAARTVQSGLQTLPAKYGAVTAIASGQFFGLVFQQRGISRFTYIGGDVVFQVQDYERTRGAWFPNAMTQVGGLSYFIATDGFYVTDGQTVTPIGDGKVDKFFLADCDQTFRSRVTVAIDFPNKCIFWSYPNFSATNGLPNRLIIYNWVRNRWARAEDTMQLLFSSISQGLTLDGLDTLYSSLDAITVSLDSPVWQGGASAMMAIGSDSRTGTFSGPAAVATIETGETEIVENVITTVLGLKPLVTGSPSAITIAVGLRDTQDNASRAFGSAISRTTRTGICDFRDTGRYISAQVVITGGFTRAIGIQVVDPVLNGKV